MSYIDNILENMEKKGISIYKLCKDTGIKQQSFQNWKNGSMPPVDKIVKIIKYLGASPYEILNIELEESNQELTKDEKELLFYFGKLPELSKKEYISEIKGAAKMYSNLSEKSSDIKTG